MLPHDMLMYASDLFWPFDRQRYMEEFLLKNSFEEVIREKYLHLLPLMPSVMSRCQAGSFNSRGK